MKIAIIGCGYLGSRVAALWSARGHQVTATTRSPERLKELSEIAQKSVLYHGYDLEELFPILEPNEVILVTISAESPEHYEHAYLGTARLMRRAALEISTPKRLIYTSSTSVYGEHHGYWVDEASELKATSDQARILMQTEEIYLSLRELGWSPLILRLAELYGPERELRRRLESGERMWGHGNDYTNMVHQEDVALAIDYGLRHHLEGIFNVVDDDHTIRKELYQRIAKAHHLPKVVWGRPMHGMQRGNKRVSNHKLKATGFVFHHPEHSSG